MSKLSLLYWKIQVAKISRIITIMHEYAKKMAFAVLIAEYLLAGGYYMAEKHGILDFLQPKTVIITLTKEAHAKEIEPEAPKEAENPKTKTTEEALADYIYFKESSNGKNDDKCERIGGHNGYGFGQGAGRNLCLNSDEEVRALVIDWIKDKEAKGMSAKQLLCYYNTGTIADSCEYVNNL